MSEHEFQSWAIAEFKGRKFAVHQIGPQPGLESVADGGAACSSGSVLSATFCCDKRYKVTRLGLKKDGVSWCRQSLNTEDMSMCPHPAVLPERATRFFHQELATPAAPGVLESEEFCSVSDNARSAHFAAVWARISPKYALLNVAKHKAEDVVKAHLEYCLKSCDTAEPKADATEGSIARLKYDSCNAVVHWLPVKLGSIDGACHLASQSSTLKEEACFWGTCAEDMTLYTLLDPTPQFKRALVQVDPVDPTEGDSEALYGALNPNPLPLLVQQLMAIECSGIVTVWLSSGIDFSAMLPALRNLLAYNQHVSLVELHVAPDAVSLVKQGISNLVKSLLTTTCRKYSREVLTPYTILATNDQRIPDPSH